MEKIKLKILYVEDEMGVRESLSEFLAMFADEVISASNGKEGLELFKQHKPHIVVSDIRMPQMNGIEMVQEMKKINPEQNVIFTTAHNDNDYFIKAIELSVDGYILKPISLKKLSEKIEKISLALEYRYFKENKEKIEKEEKEKLIQKQSQMALQGEMLSMLTHQWKQPINQLYLIIQTFTRTLKGSVEAEKLDDFKAKTSDLINHITQTVNDFSSFYSPDKKKQYVSIFNLYKNIFSINSKILNSKFEFKIEYNNLENFEIFTFKNELSQVILSLLNNSIEAFNSFENKYIHVTNSKKDDTLIITIEDNAGGIKEEILGNIFEPFFTTKESTNGTGIGLYMAKVLIEDSIGGKIKVNSEEEKTIFTIEVPIN